MLQALILAVLHFRASGANAEEWMVVNLHPAGAQASEEKQTYES